MQGDPKLDPPEGIDFEDDWEDLRPNRNPAQRTVSIFEFLTGGQPRQVWVGLINPEGKECTDPWYKRQPTDLPECENVQFNAQGSLTIDSLGLWSAETEGTLLWVMAVRHQHIQNGDTLCPNITFNLD